MNVLLVIGTRPEAIKLAPVYHALRDTGMQVTTCCTGQHRELAQTPLTLFGIEPDVWLRPKRKSGSMHSMAADTLDGLRRVIARAKPDWIIVQGDTTSTLAGAMAGYYSGVRVAHVEAGLRSGDRFAPYPEEANRRAVAAFADLHLAPTDSAWRHLRAEGIRANVFVTGNTVVDALEMLRSQIKPAAGRYALVTAHRRENHAHISRICEALARLAEEIEVVVSVHPNPMVRLRMSAGMAGVENVRLLEPVPYLDWLGLMAGAQVILTDSGGIQEEAPSFGVPVVVLRNVTERPEAVEAGFARLAGTDPERIYQAAHEMLDKGRVTGANPFGDGKAAERIARILTADGR